MWPNLTTNMRAHADTLALGQCLGKSQTWGLPFVVNLRPLRVWFGGSVVVGWGMGEPCTQIAAGINGQFLAQTHNAKNLAVGIFFFLLLLLLLVSSFSSFASVQGAAPRLSMAGSGRSSPGASSGAPASGQNPGWLKRCDAGGSPLRAFGFAFMQGSGGKVMGDSRQVRKEFCVR